MSLKALLEGRVEDYVAENADVPGAFWYFIHIPKTAGSSFRQELASRLAPQANIVVDRTLKDTPHRERLLAAIQQFLADARYKNCRFASGHVPRVLARPILQRQSPLRLVTMLRDPVERVISDFRYQRTDAHAGREQSVRRFPTFESYIREPGTQDKMHKFLRDGPKQPVRETIQSMEDSFAFVGLTEHYDWSLSLLFRLLDVEAKPGAYMRKTKAVKENEIEDLDRWRPVIRELNGQDVALYAHFRAGLDAARERQAKAA